MRLPELLRKQAGGLKHEWHVAAAKARVQKLCGRDEAEGLSQARQKQWRGATTRWPSNYWSALRAGGMPAMLNGAAGMGRVKEAAG